MKSFIVDYFEEVKPNRIERRIKQVKANTEEEAICKYLNKLKNKWKVIKISEVREMYNEIPC